MKTKNVALIILIFAYLLVLSACSTPDASDSSAGMNSYYTITTNEDFTYSYKIFAKNGEVLFSDDRSPREPHIEQVSAGTFSVTIQSGTGRATNWAVFCDVENSKVSETFYYVLAAQGDYVVFANYAEGKHFVIVQNIFDKSVYYKTYELEDVSPVAADFALECKFDSDGNATLTYLSGEEYSATKMTIDIP